MEQSRITDFWDRTKAGETTGADVLVDDIEQVMLIRFDEPLGPKFYFRRKDAKTDIWGEWKELPGLAVDPDNKGSVLGWGVFRSAPWHFVGICTSKEAAEEKAAAQGPDYAAGYGSHQIGTDNFVGGLTPPNA
ncbi:hypothetical protein [Pseudomonas citronellolis]|uniref:hypothetical protein n=1 Tax=Pseudomonas citronellolis TaxID=53408 RepID=UPI000B12638B|nr:hypothetical protein [Pseudomonas citronellolis]